MTLDRQPDFGYAESNRIVRGSQDRMLEDFDLNRIEDITGAREAIGRLLNLIEELAGDPPGPAAARREPAAA